MDLSRHSLWTYEEQTMHLASNKHRLKNGPKHIYICNSPFNGDILKGFTPLTVESYCTIGLQMQF